MWERTVGSEPCRAEEVVTAFLGRHAGRRLARKGAAYLAPECVIDWPCSGERIVGRSEFANVQARYPTDRHRRPIVGARHDPGSGLGL